MSEPRKRIPNRQYPVAVRAAARAIYESQPGITDEGTARIMGQGFKGSQIKSMREADRTQFGIEWQRNGFHAVPNLSERAASVADSFTKLSEAGPAMTDSTEVIKTASNAVAEEHVVNIRAAVLERHRKEWAAPRKLAYEAIKSNDFDKAKLAKISAETLTLIQAGEGKAYGLDPLARGQGGGTVVMVEREGAKETSAAQDAEAELEGAPAIEEIVGTDAGKPVVGDTSATDVF